ncbi:MAG: type III pantothenate kinase [Ignavibacteriaceae bacterium]|nr:type III pantothenate kinase [Ignavibacteriaceae bacterium]
MLLTLDIGNTNIKSALFDDQSLKEFIVHSDSDKVVEYLNKATFNEAAICSVNPRVEKLLTDNISEKGYQIIPGRLPK